mmetsp:Transcript_39246/g.79269  ORF Transcript_39246/g.79269 Transcript_39246/m.79269 type:complete len:206 (+) Transcript_39246:832-1449(+)
MLLAVARGQAVREEEDALQQGPRCSSTGPSLQAQLRGLQARVEVGSLARRLSRGRGLQRLQQRQDLLPLAHAHALEPHRGGRPNRHEREEVTLAEVAHDGRDGALEPLQLGGSGHGGRDVQDDGEVLRLPGQRGCSGRGRHVVHGVGRMLSRASRRGRLSGGQVEHRRSKSTRRRGRRHRGGGLRGGGRRGGECRGCKRRRGRGG